MSFSPRNEFFIVRHGQSENNVLRIESCNIETQEKYGLTTEGQSQVEKEAANFTDFDVIVSSPFRRTKETTACFEQSSSCDASYDERLQDIDLGDLDEKSYSEAGAAISTMGNDDVFPGGESMSACLERAKECIVEIDKVHDGKKILIVSHGFLCEALLDWAAGKPLENWDHCLENGKVFPLLSPS